MILVSDAENSLPSIRPHSRTYFSTTVCNIVDHSGVLWSWCEGSFIFRELGNASKYFQGAGERKYFGVTVY